jgi:hypothetical protein
MARANRSGSGITVTCGSIDPIETCHSARDAVRWNGGHSCPTVRSRGPAGPVAHPDPLPARGRGRVLVDRGQRRAPGRRRVAYPAPLPEIPKIENLIAFYNEKVDLIVDGTLRERPHTRWS